MCVFQYLIEIEKNMTVNVAVVARYCVHGMSKSVYSDR